MRDEITLLKLRAPSPLSPPSTARCAFALFAGLDTSMNQAELKCHNKNPANHDCSSKGLTHTKTKQRTRLSVKTIELDDKQYTKVTITNYGCVDESE